MSSIKRSSRHVFKKSSRCLQRNKFSFSKTSSRCLARCLQDVFARRLQDVFKTSWKTKNCYAEDVLKTSSRHVLKTNKCLLGNVYGYIPCFVPNLIPIWSQCHRLVPHLSPCLQVSGNLMHVPPFYFKLKFSETKETALATCFIKIMNYIFFK